MVKYELDGTAKSTPARSSNRRPNLKSRRRKKNRSSVNRHSIIETGYTVDIADLLFTPTRDFLIKNTHQHQQVRVDDLKGKTIVLFIVPIHDYGFCVQSGDTLDMAQAYNELSPMGDIEFVFVPVHLDYLHNRPPSPNASFESPEAIFNHILSTVPFPAVPFSDIAACGDRVVKTFSVDCGDTSFAMPYWVIIDPTSRVVLTRYLCPYLFKLFGGVELYPLSSERVSTLIDEHGYGSRIKSRKRLISCWDQLLASPTRDFLLSSNGDQVRISSLKGKVIGLYFCENIPDPPRMEVIKKVYQEGKSLGYDFEIVQINLHYILFNSGATFVEDIRDIEDPSVQECYQNINWLRLPFKDPSCRKLQRIFRCEMAEDADWSGDCLVIIDTRMPDAGEVPVEFSGADIIQAYGIEGYPFTGKSLVETKCRAQKKEVKLQLLFPPGPCGLMRPAMSGFDLGGDSPLFGKRVLVLFANQSECKSSTFVSMLASKYREQLQDEVEENKFEVLYVSTDCFESSLAKCTKDCSESSLAKCTKDMPWLVYPYSPTFQKWCSFKIFKKCEGLRAAAFDKDGELIAKEFNIPPSGSRQGRNELRFPFLEDLESCMLREIANTVHFMDSYYYSDIEYSDDDE